MKLSSGPGPRRSPISSIPGLKCPPGSSPLRILSGTLPSGPPSADAMGRPGGGCALGGESSRADHSRNPPPPDGAPLLPHPGPSTPRCGLQSSCSPGPFLRGPKCPLPPAPPRPPRPPPLGLSPPPPRSKRLSGGSHSGSKSPGGRGRPLPSSQSPPRPGPPALRD